MTLLTRGLLIAVLSALALSLPLPALAQSAPVFQTGAMHPHDLAKFYTNGLTGSASLNGTEGDNAGEGVNPFVIDDHKGEALCWTTAILTADHHLACLGHNVTSDPVLSVDGVDYAFPPAGNGNVLGPNASSQNNMTWFNNGLGTLVKDGGPFPEGAMHCWLPVSGGNLVCRQPGGAVVATTGTTTNGLEEGLRAACDNNLSFYVDGSSNGGQASPTGVINLSTSLDFRALRNAAGATAACPIQGKTINFGYLALNWTQSLGAANGIVFDSFMDLQFEFPGQTVYQGTGCAIAVIPTNPVPVDNFVAAIDSKIHIGYPGSQTPAAGCLWKWDGTNGAIQNVNVSWEEINGGGCPVCVSTAVNGLVLTNAAHGIQAMHFRGGRIHGFTGTGIQCGTQASDIPQIRANFFDTTIYPAAVNAIGIDLYCGHPNLGNKFETALIADEMPGISTTFTGIKAENGARSNLLVTVRNDAATPTGGDLTYKVLQSYLDPGHDMINVPQGGVPQWGVALGTCGSGSILGTNSTRGAGMITVNGSPTSCAIDFTAGSTVGPFIRNPVCVTDSPINTGGTIFWVVLTGVNTSNATFSFVDSAGAPKAATPGSQLSWHCSV